MTDTREYIQEHSSELVDLIKTLCRIPAPSNKEEKRAAFVREWFKKQCGPVDVYIDEALNVVCRVNYSPGAFVSVFMAHTDTVFPDLAPFEPEERDGRLYCPGVGDDTANLALLMLAARYVLTRKIPSEEGVLFVANAGEEGLGNLKGCRKLMEEYAGRVKQLVSFDGRLGNLVNRAVGSRRYRVRLAAQGGHSFSCFGNTNAIHLLSKLIADLYSVTPPSCPGGPTTYNVGSVTGGTSVNTIAETAEMLYEYRSTDREGLAFMEREFREAVERHRAAAKSLEVEFLGERPCTGDLDPIAQGALEQKAEDLIRAVIGKDPEKHAASTDCNIPLSQGIPAISLGGYYGEGAHRRDEFIELASLPKGFELVLGLILRCMEG
ncbi:MAG: M20/M25/M40 family metallo-hydrolase [Synergistaceae bacterium]|jgi:acetylornithine deacetylase/succinyl-diaminopimelate desuccinylase-like protein|nr:M20/M25/M40 family metallo-hydrolase [Synergistaceae bacterium]